jgi:hypothetical protein
VVGGWVERASEDMVVNFDAALGEAVCPGLVDANFAGVVQKVQGIFLAGEAAEFGIVGVVRGNEGFLAVEDGGIAGARLGANADFPGVDRDLDTEFQGGVGVFVEVRIDEIG